MVNSYIIPIPIAYNNSPTADPLCAANGNTLGCPANALLGDSDPGSLELNTGKVYAWDREVNIYFTIQPAKVRKVNLFFYNIPLSGIGLPPSELFCSNLTAYSGYSRLSHVILGNQDLSQNDRTLRNVSLVVTTDSIPSCRFFRIRFTFTAETSLIDRILLSEVQLCAQTGVWVSVFCVFVGHWCTSFKLIRHPLCFGNNSSDGSNEL